MGDGNVANGIVGEWWDKVIHADGDQVALSVSELADLSGRIDAALRRAKAEGVRGLIGHEQLAIQILNALERGGYLVSGPDGEEIGMTILDEADEFLDARAAQIEEGEDLK